MRWTDQHLANYLERTGLKAPAPVVDTSNPPFALPDVVLDLPPPISVNKLRRINWQAQKRAENWRKVANGFLMTAKTRKENPIRFDRIDRFEITITLSEAKVFLDLDNAVKLLIDYIRHVNIIKDDAPANMRKLTVIWGDAPLGTRITVSPCT